MADARETARAWLAERLHAADCGCDTYDERAAAHYGTLADAILSADGVEVELRKLARPNGTGFFGYEPTHEQVVIRLPAQPIGDGDG